MIHYEVFCDSPNQHFIGFKAVFPVKNEETILKISAWRPGRYEFGNFAKNIRGFKVFNEFGSPIEFQKLTKNSWLIQSKETKNIRVEYEYFAAEMNAGSSYLDDTQLYINPVNCFLFVDELLNDSYEILFNIEDSWKIACSLKQDEHVLMAKDFNELADSPLICSANLSYNSYEINDIVFHIWFNNQKHIDWNRLKNDFTKFTRKQINSFGHFPVKEFHYLIHSLPYPTYHGVEHLKSMVLTLGPSYDIFSSLYSELLGVSSHELYHVWNIKSIRPKEMLPYNYEAENYSRLGYVYEGVTTYLGDLYLLKSGVFSLEEYLIEFNRQLQRHFDNPGRQNYSVAQSSYDTWLDGYVAGVPARKVSIYTEGCLLAFIADVKIRKATKNKFGIEEVMRRLYVDFALNNKGYSEADYRQILEQVSGVSFESYFTKYINGTICYKQEILDSLEYLGLNLLQIPAKLCSESTFGFKTISKGKSALVQSFYPGSPAQINGLSIGDEIISINGIQLNADLDKWLEYFGSDPKTLTAMREGRMTEINLLEGQDNYYPIYKAIPLSNIKESQATALKKWGEDGINS